MPTYGRTYSRSKLGAKRRRIAGSYGGASSVARRSIPRPLASNTCIIPLSCDYDMDLTADIGRGFGFSTAKLWVNGTSTTTLTGASEVAAVFDLMRLVKVDIVILPGNDTRDYANNTVGSGQAQIPWCYSGLDYNDSTNPSLSDIHQNPFLRRELFNHAIKRTFIPTLSQGGLVVDFGASAKDKWVKAGDDTQIYCGYKIYVDMLNTVNTYSICRMNVKCYFECSFSK